MMNPAQTDRLSEMHFFAKSPAIMESDCAGEAPAHPRKIDAVAIAARRCLTLVLLMWGC
jgi:hypothetical protein